MTYLKCRCAHFPLNMPVYCQWFCHSATASSSQVVDTMAPTQMAPVTVPAVTEAGDEPCHRIFATSPCEFFGRQPQHQLHLQFRTEVAIFERFGGWLQSFSWTVFGSDRSAKPFASKTCQHVKQLGIPGLGFSFHFWRCRFCAPGHIFGDPNFSEGPMI